MIIRVTNNEERYDYDWTVTTFRDRLFVIRDIVDEFFDTGEKPNSPKVDDPFWDPPTPILIGQAFLPLNSLGYVCDSDVDAAILSADGSAK